MIKMLAILLIAVLMIAAVVVLIDYLSVGVVNVDLTAENRDMTHSATGFLYGLAEPGVPSLEITRAITPDTLAAKTAGGLQHPIGDVVKVGGQFMNAGGKAMQVYLQDIYPLWYYAEEGVTDHRADFLSKAPAALQAIKDSGYAGDVTVILFNESDNGSEQWFGKFGDWHGGKLVYDRADYTANRAAFYADYKAIYAMAKELGLKVGGPNYCVYNSFLIKDFLSFCKQNDCLPDVVAWHELITGFGKDWEEHYTDYRAIEKELGIEPIKICINEYGRMEDNGKPDATLMYISGFEAYDVSACIAYWRLANNLCDLTADANTPTANWWLYRWYAEMTGKSYELSYDGSGEAYGMAGGDGKEVSALLTGLVGKNRIEFNAPETLFGEEEHFTVTVEAIRYNGLSTPTVSPTLISREKVKKLSDRLVINVNADKDVVYRVSVAPYNGEREEEGVLPVRYEAENAQYKGMEKVGSAYAKSGDLLYNMTDDAGITFTVNAETSGRYKVSLIYGNGAATAAERRNAELYLSVDGGSETKLSLPSTIKHYYTDAHAFYLDLGTGSHTLTLTKKSADGAVGAGSVCLDFLDVERIGEHGEGVVFTSHFKRDKLSDGCVFMTVVPADGYYKAEFSSANTAKITVNGVEVAENKEGLLLYLKRGVNYVGVEGAEAETLTLTATKSVDAIVITPADLTVEGGRVEKNEYSPTGAVVTGVSNLNGGSVTARATVAEAGVYAVKITYANSEENGVHSYNTDLVERYAIISVNGGAGELTYFRNTYSDDSFSTVVLYVGLNAGENVITLLNDGRYVWKGAECFLPDLAEISVMPAFR